MQIDVMSGAAANVASATESTAASPEAGKKTPSSFADLLNGVADDQDDSTPVDEVDEEELAGDEWVTMPLVAPFVPVIPQDVVEIEDGNATSVEAIGEDIAAEDVDTPLPAPVAEVVTAPDVKSFVDAKVPQPREAKQTESPPVRETSALRTPAVDAHPVEIVGDILSEAVESDAKIEAATAIASKEATAAEPGAKLDKAARTASVPKTVDANETAKPAATDVAANSAVQSAVHEVAASQAESVSNNGSSEPAPAPKGVAARFARAIERAIEHAVAPAAGTGENNQSSNQNADGQPSFGEWLREQLPQLAARAHNGTAPVFALAAPAQNDARVSGLLAASGVKLPASTSALPNERDMTLQIVQSMRMQFRDGIGEAVLRLKPEHLGSVSISLRVENGGLKANVQADLPAVRQWLESQQDTLRSALAEHGLRLDRFDVEPDGQRRSSPESRDERSPRKRRARPTTHSEQPVFEVVV
jgi:flagellar hook-length control protein FliK